MKTMYKIECNNCGNTWYSEHDDLAEWCECSSDDIKVIDEESVDPTCCPKCDGLLTLGHLSGCQFRKI